MEWLEPAVNAAEAAANVVQNREKWRNSVFDMWARFRDQHLRLPVFGAAGSGKSTFGRSLVSEDPYGVAKPYRESMGIEVRKLEGPVSGDIVVAPGQKRRIARQWADLYKLLMDEKATGFCNVVSYGYHSFEHFDVANLDVPKDAKNADLLTAFCEKRREAELEVLDELLSSLRNVQASIWMVTVINKQDIWWSSRDDVRDFYTNGRYAEILNRFQKRLGDVNFEHTFIPCSLTIENFNVPPSGFSAPNCEGYDVPLHLAYMNSCLGKLHGLINPRQN